MSFHQSVFDRLQAWNCEITANKDYRQPTLHTLRHQGELNLVVDILLGA
jgi:hypothetical protein